MRKCYRRDMKSRTDRRTDRRTQTPKYIRDLDKTRQAGIHAYIYLECYIKSYVLFRKYIGVNGQF